MAYVLRITGSTLWIASTRRPQALTLLKNHSVAVRGADADGASKATRAAGKFLSCLRHGHEIWWVLVDPR
jgi:hypothetical protein